MLIGYRYSTLLDLSHYSKKRLLFQQHALKIALHIAVMDSGLSSNLCVVVNQTDVGSQGVTTG